MDLNLTQNLNRVRRLLGLFCLCIFFSMRAGIALAASGEEKSLATAEAAYKAKNYSLAIKLFRPLAEQGNADSQNSLGDMYEIERDFAKAVKWYRKAAEQGNADAQFSLGGLYSLGVGVKQDDVKAGQWYRKAAEQGNAGCQNTVGWMYEHGQWGVEKDYVKAVKWFRKAAEQGDADAQNNLGPMYESGEGVPQNYVEAYKWLALSAAQGIYPVSKDSSTKMGNLSQKMTPDQIAKAQELASSWKAVGQAAPPQSSEMALKQAAVKQSQNPPKKEIRSSVDTPDYHLSPRPNDFAIVVGIEDYDNDLPQSEFSKRDAKAFKRHLLALGVPPSHIQFLIGGRATGNALKARIEEWLPKNVKPDSTVFFYFSGHGAPDPATGDAYLVPFDGDPEYLKDTAYPLNHLYSELSGLKAHQVIVALDSCFSGAGGRSIIAKGTRPLVSEIKEGAIPRNGKLIVLTASKSSQISGVIESEGHGAFTYYFLKGLNGKALNRAHHVTLGSLYHYLAPKVSDAANLDNRDQNPQMFPDNLAQDLRITLR